MGDELFNSLKGKTPLEFNKLLGVDDKENKKEPEFAIKTTWYGGRRYFLKEPSSSPKGKKSTDSISLDEVITLTAQKNRLSQDKAVLASALWTLHEQGKASLSERNLATRILSHIVKGNEAQHAAKIMEELFGKTMTTENMKKLPASMLQVMAKEGNEQAKQALSALEGAKSALKEAVNELKSREHDEGIDLLKQNRNHLEFSRAFDHLSWLSPDEKNAPENVAAEDCMRPANESFQKAFSWYHNKGWSLEEGEYYPRNDALEFDVVKGLERSSSRGNPEANYLLANYYRNRSNAAKHSEEYRPFASSFFYERTVLPPEQTDKDYQKAISLYQEAAKQTNDISVAKGAIKSLMQIYGGKDNQGRKEAHINPKMQEEGVQFFKELADKPFNNKEAAGFLGEIYDLGLLGQGKNRDEANAWRRIAAR